MADSKKTAYGNAASDTDFRKQWDHDYYERKAKEEEERHREDGKARAMAKLEGKKWHKPVDISTLGSTSSRDVRIDVAAMVGKSTLVPKWSAIGKRGRGAGFYCEDCDLTYKDNVQYIEHLNSKQHLINTGQSGEVVRATLQDVKDRLEMLKRRKRDMEEDEKRMGEIDLDARLKTTAKSEDRAREERRRRRNEKRRKNGANGIKKEVDEWEGRLGIIA